MITEVAKILRLSLDMEYGFCSGSCTQQVAADGPNGRRRAAAEKLQQSLGAIAHTSMSVATCISRRSQTLCSLCTFGRQLVRRAPPTKRASAFGLDTVTTPNTDSCHYSQRNTTVKHAMATHQLKDRRISAPCCNRARNHEKHDESAAGQLTQPWIYWS
jgi:hypothetical protein